MTSATQVGQAGLQGWRAKVADAVADPVAKRTRLDADQVRAAIGMLFLVLALSYVAKTVAALTREARTGTAAR